jgi:N-acetyl-anhydromuramyl-L-alanine amidase AmpD
MSPDSQASAHWVISPTDTVRMVSDEFPSWTTGKHNWQGYNIELTQPLWNTPFEDGHYANLARVCADYVRQGIPIRRIEYLPYSSKEEGFVQHQDTEQGISVGKSDMGVMFDWARFFAELRNEVQEEDDMGMTEHERSRLEKAEKELERLRDQSISTLQAQVDWLRQELGQPPLYDDGRTHPSGLLAQLGSNLNLQQIADGLKVTPK